MDNSENILMPPWKIKEQARKSIIRGYTNGYEAHWIDKHPYRDVFRDPNGDVTAFSYETIVLLNYA